MKTNDYVLKRTNHLDQGCTIRGLERPPNVLYSALGAG